MTYGGGPGDAVGEPHRGDLQTRAVLVEDLGAGVLADVQPVHTNASVRAG